MPIEGFLAQSVWLVWSNSSFNKGNHCSHCGKVCFADLGHSPAEVAQTSLIITWKLLMADFPIRAMRS